MKLCRIIILYNSPLNNLPYFATSGLCFLTIHSATSRNGRWDTGLPFLADTISPK